MNKKTIHDVDVAGKRVLVRVDFNVPLQDGVVSDDTRIQAALPTLTYLLDQGAALILCSHLGRPKGVDPALSMAPVADRLGELLDRPVVKADAVVGAESTSVSMSRSKKEKTPPPSRAGRKLVAAGLVAVAVAAGFAVGAVALHLFRDSASEQEQTQVEKNGPVAPAVSPVFADVTAQAGLNYRHEAGLAGRFYYPDGTPQMEVRFRDNRRDGLAKEYYPSGKLKSVWLYKEGKLDGATRQYYPSGLVKAEAVFRDGRRHGLTRTYGPSGNVLFTHLYEKGTLLKTESHAASSRV